MDKGKTGTEGPKPRRHSPDKNKNISTTNAKALRPEMLDTSLPSMQMKDWYCKWDNYKEASGWGQGDNHKTQLAYLRTVVSDEIRTAINFDGLNTVAIHEIRKCLNMAVMPVTLQWLEMLRYKFPAGQSQTLTTQSLVQMF